jgi:hypothetical protein
MRDDVWSKQIDMMFSREGTPRYIEVLDANNYLIYGNSNYLRFGDDFIDYEGGPFIAKGQPLYGSDERVIVDIKPCITEGKPNCYKITVV